MAKQMECKGCGCQRQIMLKAKVRLSKDNKNSMDMDTHWTCLKCFMGMLNIAGTEKGTYDRAKVMACVETEET